MIIPDGTMGWPFVGETLSFLKPHPSFTIGPFLQDRCSRYGKVFKSHLFGSPAIVSCDHELNTFILQNERKLFPPNYPKVMHDILGKYGMILITGDIHKKLRNVILNIVKQTKSESHYLHCVQKLSLSTINSWQNRNHLAFYQQAKQLALHVMLKYLLHIDPEEPVAFKILADFETYIKGFVSLPLKLPGTAYAKAMKARVRVLSTLEELLRERKSKGLGRLACPEGGDYLHIILANENLNQEEMVSLVFDMLFGGYETTAKLLSLIVYFLSKAPNALQKLKEEHMAIRRSKKDGELLTWEDYQNMKFTNNVIYEASRCGNIVKFLHRKSLKDIKYKDFVIPSGWLVVPVLSAPHLDSSLHENPQQFNPWRWQDETTMKKVAPLGGGPHLCPGFDLAKIEISFFLHHLILNYRWKTRPDEYPLAYPYVEFTMGLQLQIESINIM